MTTRDEIRSGFFSNKASKRDVLLSSGFTVEVRQPSVGDQMALLQIEGPDRRMLQMFVDNVYVPGTEDKVFEVADYETLKEQPAGGDYTKIMEALTALMNISAAAEAAKKP